MPPIRWRSHESLLRCGAGDYQRSSSRRRTTSGLLLLRLLLGKFGESLSLVVSSTGFLRKFWRGFVAPKAGPPARASGYHDHPHGGSGDPQVEAPAGHRRAPAVGHRRWPPRSGRSAWLFYRSDQQACVRTKGAAGGLPRQVAWSPGAIAQRPVHAHLNDDSKPAIPPNPIPPSPSPKGEPSNIDHPVGSRPASACRR